MLAPWLSGPVPAAASDGPETLERLFVARAEQPGLTLRVTSLRGGDVFEGRTGDGGQLVFTLEVADSDELRFESASEGWRLDWVVKVRNAHLDPDIPLELDVGGFLRRVEPGDDPAAESVSEPNQPKQPKQPKTTAEVDPDAPCRGAGDIPCLLRLQRRLAEARARGDCRGALRLAQQLLDEVPSFAASDPAAVELASLHFECALAERLRTPIPGSGPDRTARDQELRDQESRDRAARSELLLRRAVALAAGPDGAGWCHPQRSRLLAAAHAELRETATAAAAARRARQLCPSSPVPVEWEFSFRLDLGQVDRAAEVAAEGSRETKSISGTRLAAFLTAWAAYAGGGCPDVTPWLDASPTPCTVLPERTCSRARTGWILRCADEAQLGVYAEALRGRTSGPGAGDLDEGAVEDLAEVEFARGAWSAAADLFGRLLTSSSPSRSGETRSGETQSVETQSPRRGLWACRRGDVLLRAGRPEEALAAFEAASSAWRGTRLTAPRLDRLVVANNVLVLSHEVSSDAASDSDDESRRDAVASRLAELPDEESYRPWRLAVENNLLELRTRADAARAAEDPVLARAAVERLRAVEEEVRRHVESVLAIGGEGGTPRACARLVFVGDVFVGDVAAGVEDRGGSGPQ